LPAASLPHLVADALQPFIILSLIIAVFNAFRVTPPRESAEPSRYEYIGEHINISKTECYNLFLFLNIK